MEDKSKKLSYIGGLVNIIGLIFVLLGGFFYFFVILNTINKNYTTVIKMVADWIFGICIIAVGVLCCFCGKEIELLSKNKD